jgi:hypothetical protein
VVVVGLVVTGLEDPAGLTEPEVWLWLCEGIAGWEVLVVIGTTEALPDGLMEAEELVVVGPTDTWLELVVVGTATLEDRVEVLVVVVEGSGNTELRGGIDKIAGLEDVLPDAVADPLAVEVGLPEVET